MARDPKNRIPLWEKDLKERQILAKMPPHWFNRKELQNLFKDMIKKKELYVKQLEKFNSYSIKFVDKKNIPPELFTKYEYIKRLHIDFRRAFEKFNFYRHRMGRAGHYKINETVGNINNDFLLARIVFDQWDGRESDAEDKLKMIYKLLEKDVWNFIDRYERSNKNLPVTESELAFVMQKLELSQKLFGGGSLEDELQEILSDMKERRGGRY